MIDIIHHGAVDGVTGSCHELRFLQATKGSDPRGSDPTHKPAPKNVTQAQARAIGVSPQGDRPRRKREPNPGILIDCGLFQGTEAKNRSTAESLAIEFPISHLRALVVTHVHIDHVGRIPYLLAADFDGPIICSEPSAIMLPEILEDALKIGFTRDRGLINRVLEVIRSRLVPVPYGQWQSVFDEDGASLKVRLQRAGHILGSAYVECDVVSGAESERIVFSGDLGAPHSPLLPEPSPPERADRLVIESTYGNKNHEDRETRRYRLKAVLEHALQDGGTVLIPAFSIGRTQELLYEIEGLIAEFGDAEMLQATKGSDPNGTYLRPILLNCKRKRLTQVVW